MLLFLETRKTNKYINLVKIMKKIWLFTVFLILLGNAEVSYGCKWCHWFCGCCGCCDSDSDTDTGVTQPLITGEIPPSSHTSDVHHAPSSISDVVDERDERERLEFASDKGTVSILDDHKFSQLTFYDRSEDDGAITGVGIEQRSFWLAPRLLRPVNTAKNSQLQTFFREMPDRFDQETLRFLFTARNEIHYERAILVDRGGDSIEIGLYDLNRVYERISDLISAPPMSLAAYLERHQRFQQVVVGKATEYSSVAKIKAFNIMTAFWVLCNRLQAYSSSGSTNRLECAIRYKIVDRKLDCIYLSVLFCLGEQTVYEGGVLIVPTPENVTCYLVRPVSGSYHIEEIV